GASRGRRRAAPAQSPNLQRERHRSPPRPAVGFQAGHGLAAEHAGTVADTDETTARRVARIALDPDRVAGGQVERGLLVVEPDRDAGEVAVPEGVGQHLLDDAVDRDVQRLRQILRYTVNLQLRGHARRADPVEQLVQVVQAGLLYAVL